MGARAFFTTLALCALVLAVAGPAHARQAWSDSHIADLADALSEAWTHGLTSGHYPAPEAVLALSAGPERDALAREGFMALARDLAIGRIDPRQLEPDWTAPQRRLDLDMAMATALRENAVFATLEGFSPSHPDYMALRRELIRRHALLRAHSPIAGGPRLGLGDSGARVDALRARLHQEGLLARLAPPDTPFDDMLRTALIRFQARHNLATDGVVGPGTLRELNTPPRHRLDQVRANLERWRWVPRDLGERHIRVNLADYRLEAWSGGQVERVHRSMIGRGYNRTPIFSEDMTFIEINPVWYTPTSLGAPWLRRFQTNPGYALASGYRLVDQSTGRVVNPSQADWANGRYRVIQVPGRGNSMGEVKFMFPNIHNIYIHDTPHRALFDNVQRNESSGCVRVDEPRELAWWVLQGETGWTREAMEEAFDNGRTRRVWLRNHIPVHILYFTAVSDRFGHVRFIHDIYSRDAALIAALDADARGESAVEDHAEVLTAAVQGSP
ncbi:peptidoglycan binding domain-containing protein [Glycocaulis alkaliphilus]|uniref:Peptidoglycan binding domain-containing protein n=1 Tax=Glycocaulis alkaliphilus TaxID=1434191 RepID=A0A3T0ECG2_9PROT|nr:L,D-transpeptidase family protein [Glycocaulis alkaliphilus]AZU04974.1 peptidoglycan binding domain-containing protein [Glycocaulis alkaliphilus]GGB66272.1 peptidoglycan-binding protein [Glycocaulis alkaliphilus]